MPGRLFRYYQHSRVVNINANVILAGLLALLPTAGVVRLSKVFITTDQKWVYTSIAVATDIIADVVIYFALHWIANHWRPFKGRSGRERRKLEAKPPPFLKDATLVQFERALLSPLYYVTAGLLMQFAQHQGIKAYWAVFIAFPAGLLVTRVAHTIWGLHSGTLLDHDKQEERRARRASARKPGAPGAAQPDPRAGNGSAATPDPASPESPPVGDGRGSGRSRVAS